MGKRKVRTSKKIIFRTDFSKRRIALFLFLGLLVFGGIAVGWNRFSTFSVDVFPSPAEKERYNFDRMVEEISRCHEASLEKQMPCFQSFFAGAFKVLTVAEVAKEFESALAKNELLRLNCHPVVHAIGREAFNALGDLYTTYREGTSFEVCAGGFFHGAMEALFRQGDTRFDAEHITVEEIKDKLPTLCDRFREINRRDQCIHGAGHGILYFLGYDMDASFKVCEALSVTDRFPCYTGIFMENLLAYETPLRRIGDADPHFPCNTYTGSIYRNPCYYVQSFRMHEMGLSNQEIVAECNKVEGFAETLCLRGLGIFYLSHEALAVGPQPTVSFCESLENEYGARYVRICAESVASRLVAHTEDGKFAMPFCAVFVSSDFRRSCFAYTADVLRVGFGVDSKTIREECEKFVPEVGECKIAI